ncbi:hypothetical protein BC833DRAFT_570753 [Globomyces pollinis-pini]|nr:hypothetical protein BC833DRAFT_570753 [Globomyces pollinis-pini]
MGWQLHYMEVYNTIISWKPHRVSPFNQFIKLGNFLSHTNDPNSKTSIKTRSYVHSLHEPINSTSGSGGFYVHIVRTLIVQRNLFAGAVGDNHVIGVHYIDGNWRYQCDIENSTNMSTWNAKKHII